LFLVGGVNAQEPPAQGRPVDFTGLVGRFRIEAAIEPAKVVVEDPVTLTITIRGDKAGPPPSRGNLRLPAELKEQFFVEDIPELDRTMTDGKAWEFVWRLRPKTTDIREVPPLQLSYYAPMLRRYQSARTEGMPLVVQARESVVVPDQTPVAFDPAFMEVVPFSGRTEVAATTWLDSLGWRWWLVVGPILAVLSWRSARPRTAIRRGSAADLAATETNPERALLRYLELRFGWTAAEPTPGEIDRVLKRAGVSAESRGHWRNWWHERDASRFSPVATMTSARPEATELIRLIEEEPCSRR
jgi:hypothetical protein